MEKDLKKEEPAPLTATLLLSCPDRKGLVARIAQFIFQRGGNILNLDEHVEKDENMFFTRVEWDAGELSLSTDAFEQELLALAREISAEWKMTYNRERRRLAIFASRHEHCIREILWLNSIGELDADVRMIVSNHETLRHLGEQYGIPFHCHPITEANRLEQEALERELLAGDQIDTIILARYMRVLSPEFVNAYPFRIINIHHSFLPAFSGANPYRQAYEKGVKLIGATSHYVTEVLDEGPIIEQGVTRISHRDSPKDLISKGRELERSVLARAIRLHLGNRVLPFGKKTIIFE